MIVSVLGATTLCACSGANATSQSMAPTAASACAALSNPASLVFNAPIDLAAGDITVEQRNAQLDEATRLFGEVDAPPGPLQDAVSALVDYLLSVEQGPDGRPFDPSSSEYGRLESHVIQACTAAGQDFIVKGHGG